MTDKTNNNGKRLIHASQVASMRLRKIKLPPAINIEEAFINGQKRFNDWFIEKMKQDKKDNN